MGRFRVEIVVRNLDDPARSRRIRAMVDTTLLREVIEALDRRAIGARRVVRTAVKTTRRSRPSSSRSMVGIPAFCLDRPIGRPVLPGAVTREEFALGVDPVAERLVPVRSSLAREHAERSTAA
jgi:hypothetical protein